MTFQVQSGVASMTLKEANAEVRKRRNPNVKEVFVNGLEANPFAGLGALSNQSLFESSKKEGK